MSCAVVPLLSGAAEKQEVPTEPLDLLAIVSSGSPETQMMAMVLSTQAKRHGAEVHILLCDAAGDLALKSSESPPMKPISKGPKDLLTSLMQEGVAVEVCALFLPNRNLDASDLLDGVTVAAPPEIGARIVDPQARVLTF